MAGAFFAHYTSSISRVVMQVSDRVAVLNHGELIAEGPPETVRRDPAVIAAYLGEPA